MGNTESGYQPDCPIASFSWWHHRHRQASFLPRLSKMLASKKQSGSPEMAGNRMVYDEYQLPFG